MALMVVLPSLPRQALAQEGADDPAEETVEAPDEANAGDPATESESSGPTADEDGFVTPTDEQAELNTDAVQAIKKEEYDEAIGLLRDSLEIGELNITYLNLGRAHQKLDECGSAKSAYLEALSAPQVQSPSPFLIEQKVEQYLTELEKQCEDRDWEKSTSGTAGSGEYTWDPRPSGSSPMFRIGFGLGTGASQLNTEGDVTVLDNDSVTRSVEALSYTGLTLKIEGIGGYFISRNFAVHGGLALYLIPSPSSTYDLPNEEELQRAPENSPTSAIFGRLSAGVTGYIPGDIFISGGLGIGFGGADDPQLDYATGAGLSLDLMLGKDFQIDEKFAFGLGGYLDIVGQPTDQGWTYTSVTLGIQSHGIIRLR